MAPISLSSFLAYLYLYSFFFFLLLLFTAVWGHLGGDDKLSDWKCYLFKIILQIVNTAKGMHNICVAQAVAEYFYFDLREASGPEIDDSQ